MIDLHLHTKFSLLDSISEPEELIIKQKELGRNAVCVTEHGNLYSSIELYKLCQKHEVKYLHGCEMYICDDVNVRDKSNRYYHLVLISKNETGRLNLIRLVSESNKYKYYGKPRIDFNLLKQYKDGLIVLSACMAGEIQRNLKSGNDDNAVKIALKYKMLFQDDYYLEYQSHKDPEQQLLNRKIVDLAKKLKIKYVVTTDSHYISKDEQNYHDVFVKIGQSRETGETYNDCFVQTEEEVKSICQSTKEENAIAIKNTHEVADKCDVKIPLSAPIMVHVDIPEKFKNEADYLKHLCIVGWKTRRIHEQPKNIQKEYKERLRYEIDVITKMGFEGYFILVWSYANSVKRRGIARGSGGGSLVAYLTNIVDIDPIQYGLYFERFIDVGALELLEKGQITKNELKIPDFDLDFGQEDRNIVINKIIKKYGEERFAALGSFQYIWAKGAIKDLGKVLNIPFSTTNEMTKLLNKESIAEALELGLLDKYKNKYPKLFEYAERLAGLPKSFSKHPCGKVIAMEHIHYYNAVDISEDGTEYVLQGDMNTAEDLGLVKIDVLGLRSVDVIYDTLEMIGKDYDYIAPQNMNFSDQKVLDNFKHGFTSLVFQFESAGMKRTLKQIDANSLYDLFVANALYRPGSMDYIENYGKRRKGVEEYEFLHKDLEPILKDSYAIIVFQEQLIEIGKLANLNNPDELRQATAKKKEKLLNKIQPELFANLSKRGWTQDQVDELWSIMIKFAKYSFNKSHSAAYAMIAYICMYLKTYHPKEFITACINSYKGKVEKLPDCMSEAKRLGIDVVIPNWNEISAWATYDSNRILIGTKNIKDLNEQNGVDLENLSHNQYDSFYEMLIDVQEKTSINSTQLNNLISLGSFREFGKSKKLLNYVSLFNELFDAKQIAKNKVDKLDLPHYIFEKYSRQTEKTYMDVDVKSILEELWEVIPDDSLNIREIIDIELNCLNYINFQPKDMPDTFYVVTTFKTYKSKAKPYVTLHQISTGDSIRTNVQSERDYIANPFKLHDVLKITDFEEVEETKRKGNEYFDTGNMKDVMYMWQIM